MIVNQPGEPNGNGIGSTSPPTNDTRTIVELCDEYLSLLHAASWGRSFYITSDDSRREAAKFTATTIEGVMEHAKRRSAKGD